MDEDKVTIYAPSANALVNVKEKIDELLADLKVCLHYLPSDLKFDIYYLHCIAILEYLLLCILSSCTVVFPNKNPLFRNLI